MQQQYIKMQQWYKNAAAINKNAAMVWYNLRQQNIKCSKENYILSRIKLICHLLLNLAYMTPLGHRTFLIDMLNAMTGK
jgi:hypothetical protein